MYIPQTTIYSLSLCLFLLGLLPLQAQQWQSLSDFGSNPGQLTAYTYVPAKPVANRPLVIVMHGCGQDATTFARLTGWNKLADAHGFAVLYPEQTTANNVQKCFNWFQPEDIGSSGGEVESIWQMAAAMISRYELDSKRVYATGFSAGGAMTTALLSAYPDRFAAGASVAGIAAGAAEDIMSALRMMRGQVTRPGGEWASWIEEQHPGYRGPWPDLMVVQGLADSVVRPANGLELVKQWTSLHGMDAEKTPADGGSLDEAPHVSVMQFRKNRQHTPVVWYKLRDWPHAYPVDPGELPSQGGQTDNWTKDADWHASYWIARFFKL
jgi:poly(hydroxyalkanoate) depolymerase family esterase